MNTSQCTTTTGHTGWFAVGMTIIAMGLVLGSLQHTHRLLLWPGMALVLVGVVVSAVPVLRRQDVGEVEQVAR